MGSGAKCVQNVRYRKLPIEDAIRILEQARGRFEYAVITLKNKTQAQIKKEQRAALGNKTRVPTTHVYFAQSGGGGPVKIGASHDPTSRICALSTASAEVVRLLAVIPGGVEVERSLHERFADTRLNGEWFEPSRELLEYIDYILQAKEGADG